MCCGRLVCDAQQWEDQSEQKQAETRFAVEPNLWHLFIKVRGKRAGGKRKLKSSPGRGLTSGCSAWLFLWWGGETERERDRPSLVESVIPAADHFALARLWVPFGSFGGSSSAARLLSDVSTTQLTHVKETALRSAWT